MSACKVSCRCLTVASQTWLLCRLPAFLNYNQELRRHLSISVLKFLAWRDGKPKSTPLWNTVTLYLRPMLEQTVLFHIYQIQDVCFRCPIFTLSSHLVNVVLRNYVYVLRYRLDYVSWQCLFQRRKWYLSYSVNRRRGVCTSVVKCRKQKHSG